jgi:hypothetical protein
MNALPMPTHIGIPAKAALSAWGLLVMAAGGVGDGCPGYLAGLESLRASMASVPLTSSGYHNILHGALKKAALVGIKTRLSTATMGEADGVIINRFFRDGPITL